MIVEGGYYGNEYYNDQPQVNEPWWESGSLEGEGAAHGTARGAARGSSARDLPTVPPPSSPTYMHFDALKQMPEAIDHRPDWLSSWQHLPVHMVEHTEAVTSVHAEREREDRWNALHLSSDNESSPGSPVSAPTFFEATHVIAQEIATCPAPSSLMQGSCEVEARPAENEATASLALTRAAAEPARPATKRRRKNTAPPPQIPQRRSSRVPVPRVCQDFARLTSDDEFDVEDDDEDDDSKRRAEHSSDAKHDGGVASCTDETDNSMSALSGPERQGIASVGSIDFEAFPSEVQQCLRISKERMLDWSEAAIILRYHLKLQQQTQRSKQPQAPRLPTRPLSLGLNDGSSGGIYVEMPKVPRPRHRRMSAKARKKLTAEKRAKFLREVLPDRWRNSGGSKGSSDLPKDATQPTVRRRYGAVLPAIGHFAKSGRQSNTSGALRYYEYTLLDEGPAGEECFLFHVVNPACSK